VHLARRLLDETSLSVTDVALSAGFSSIRRFNEVFRRTFSLSPTEVRALSKPAKSDEVLLRLPFQPPYDWDSIISFLSQRMVSGIEVIDADSYRRSINLDNSTGSLEVRRVPDQSYLELRVLATFPVDLLRIVERVRRLFDLDCDPNYISAHLGGSKELAHLVKKRPGLRVPGAWDPFELGVRAILGQQVSVKAASTLMARLVAKFGKRLELELPGITYAFPTPRQLARADYRELGVTRARGQTIRNLARAIVDKPSLLDGSREVEGTIKDLTAIPGIGPWTAQYIAMRALREPDAFPAGDLGLRKALSRNGFTPNTVDLRRAADVWRPFRAYAAMHLWRALS
jgi:AraC family transcriptional regulator of adaptative response / DNA-3-methyladenine glycosylase II